MRRVAGIVAVLVAAALNPALAYEGAFHQDFTFIAARAFNSCIDEGRLDAVPLTPLQVRYIAKTSRRQAQSNVFTRMFRWNYYDRAEHSAQRWFWLVDTRFHAHFREIDGRLAKPRSRAAYFSDLGRVVSYVQDVTSPAHAVPVYTGRFWRFSLSDRFDGFSINRNGLAQSLTDACERALDVPAKFEDILRDSARGTLAAVQSPVAGMPTHWTAFWRPSKNPADFGEYGSAGNNFGRPVQFRCGGGQRCVLLEDDPLYRSFALDRHRDAVIRTMQVMLLAHRTASLESVAPGG